MNAAIVKAAEAILCNPFALCTSVVPAVKRASTCRVWACDRPRLSSWEVEPKV